MLYHEVKGNGPVLLLIPGGNGDAGFYAPLVKALADRFTVISYDRRGFSRSAADGAVTADRLNSDCDDARGLIELVTAAPAYVFGSSSGAIVAMQLLGRHSECVRAVVAHEPPVVRLLPDSAHWLELFDDIYDIYRNKGARPAMRRFVAAAGVGPPRLGSREFWQMLRLMPRLRRNMPFWLEHELRKYTGYQPDIPALRTLSSQLRLAGGRDSQASFPHRATMELAKTLETTVVDFPGGHVGYRSHAVEFADYLWSVCAGSPAERTRTSRRAC